MNLETVKESMNQIAARCHTSNVAFLAIAIQMDDENEPGEERVAVSMHNVSQDLSDGSGRAALIEGAQLLIAALSTEVDRKQPGPIILDARERGSADYIKAEVFHSLNPETGEPIYDGETHDVKGLPVAIEGSIEGLSKILRGKFPKAEAVVVYKYGWTVFTKS